RNGFWAAAAVPRAASVTTVTKQRAIVDVRDMRRTRGFETSRSGTCLGCRPGAQGLAQPPARSRRRYVWGSFRNARVNATCSSSGYAAGPIGRRSELELVAPG